MQTNPFDPVGVEWTRIDTGLTRARRLLFVTPTAIIGVVALVVVAFTDSAVLRGVAGGVAAVAFALAAWWWRWAERSRRAIGYAESDADFLVTHGLLWRELVVVPYGRIQYVEVDAGPVAQWLGIATVTINTASAGTAVRIPGLRPDAATRLRDRLAELGEVRDGGV